MEVRKNGRPVRIRRTVTMPGVGGRVGCTFSASLHNAQASLEVRLLTAKVGVEFVPIEDVRPPEGHSAAILRYLQTVASHLTPTTPVPLVDFPELYVGRKRVVYRQAVESLLQYPLVREDAKIRAFLKYEKQLGGPGKAPRLIMPPSNRYLVWTGTYIKPAEHAIYAVIDEVFGFRTVVKGLNYQQVGELFKRHWDSVHDPVAFDIDVEKMDRSTSAEMLRATHLPVLACYSGEHQKKLSRWLKWQLTNAGKVRVDDGVIGYSVKGTLTSGQMNTSLVGILMITGAMWSFMRIVGGNYRFVDAGDDCTIILPRSSVSKFLSGIRPFFRALGFELTISEPRTCLEEVEFCQTHPVAVEGVYRMVRIPRDAVSKDAIWLSPTWTKRDAARWLYAVSESGLSTHGGVPMLQELYQTYASISDRWQTEMKLSDRQRRRLRETARLEDGSMKWWGQGLHYKYSSVSESTRYSFYLAFGITPGEQLALEDYYRHLTFDWSTVPSQYLLLNPCLK